MMTPPRSIGRPGIRVGWLLLLLALTTPGGNADQVRTEDAAQLSARAQRALVEVQQLREEGDFATAAQVLRTLLSDDPRSEHPLVRFQLANCLALASNKTVLPDPATP